MKKTLIVVLVLAALAGGGWFVAREHFAQANASQYLKEREIPVYHALSFHGKDDRNVLGFCEPCGKKARQVLADRVEKELDDTKKEIEHTLSGGRK